MRLCLGRTDGSFSFSLSLAVDALFGALGVEGAVLDALGRGCGGGGRGEEGRDFLMSDDARFSDDLFLECSDLFLV